MAYINLGIVFSRSEFYVVITIIDFDDTAKIIWKINYLI